MARQPDEIAIPKNKHPLVASTRHGVMSTIRHTDGMISSNPVAVSYTHLTLPTSDLV